MNNKSECCLDEWFARNFSLLHRIRRSGAISNTCEYHRQLARIKSSFLSNDILWFNLAVAAAVVVASRAHTHRSALRLPLLGWRGKSYFLHGPSTHTHFPAALLYVVRGHDVLCVSHCHLSDEHLSEFMETIKRKLHDKSINNLNTERGPSIGKRQRGRGTTSTGRKEMHSLCHRRDGVWCEPESDCEQEKKNAAMPRHRTPKATTTTRWNGCEPNEEEQNVSTIKRMMNMSSFPFVIFTWS